MMMMMKIGIKYIIYTVFMVVIYVQWMLLEEF